jgi:hypothetical protein
MQGIANAEKAEAAVSANSSTGNTWVYVVAYGADTSSSGSCTLDSGTGPTPTNGLSAPLSAQCALNLIVDNHVTDTTYTTDGQYKSNLPGCKSSVAASDPTHRFYVQAPGTSLTGVFQEIAEQATSARLVSNNAT